MSGLRVVVLEDEPAVLKELVVRLRDSNLVEVVDYAKDRNTFMQAVQNHPPDALILDIDLVGEPEGGLAIARDLALPVLFFSGHVGKYIDAIEILDSQRTQLPVAHLTKTCEDDVFTNRLKKFVEQVHGWQKGQMVTLRPKDKGSTIEVPLSDIVAITVDQNGASSNNKVILFKERKPVVVADVTLSRLRDFGIPETAFKQISASRVVNRMNVLEWTRGNAKVRYTKRDGSPVTELFPISETFRKKRG